MTLYTFKKSFSNDLRKLIAMKAKRKNKKRTSNLKSEVPPGI
tara:strand:- start:558 stop:683 length:126 start_codon:yes stop_codon:yes gene_type:complete